MKCPKCNATNLNTNSRCRLCANPFRLPDSESEAPSMIETGKISRASEYAAKSWSRSWKIASSHYKTMVDSGANPDVIKGFKMCMEVMADS